MNESTTRSSSVAADPDTFWRGVDARRAAAVSLLMPADESDRDLGARLSAALRQTVPAHEILVLDTTPDGRHFATFCRWADQPGAPVLRYLRLPGLTARQARSRGSRVAAGKIRVVVAAGVAPATSWVERAAAIVRQWLAASAGAVAPERRRVDPALA